MVGYNKNRGLNRRKSRDKQKFIRASCKKTNKSKVTINCAKKSKIPGITYVCGKSKSKKTYKCPGKRKSK